MITKYNTGDVVLIPSTIQSAEIIDEKIFYHIREYPGTPECPVVIHESKIAGRANINTGKAD